MRSLVCHGEQDSLEHSAQLSLRTHHHPLSDTHDQALHKLEILGRDFVGQVRLVRSQLFQGPRD